MSERARGASLEHASAILRAILELDVAEPAPHTPGIQSIWQELIGHLQGRVGWRNVSVSADDDAIAQEEAARAFACLDRPVDAFALLVRLDPRRQPGVLGTALRVLPQMAPASLFAQRRWIARLLPALLDGPLGDEIEPLIQALHRRGHFEMVEALRRSRLGETIAADSWRLIDARQACWAGRYDEVETLLAGVSLSGTRQIEADVLLAVAGSRRGAPPSDAEMVALLARAAHVPGLDEVVERWRAEIALRADCPDRGTLSEALKDPPDHVAVRLLHRIVACTAPPRPPSDDPLWGFHTYVLEALREAGVAEADAAISCTNPAEEGRLLWRVLDRLGGNRTDFCTIIENGGIRPVEIRTARQEAVATQGLLPALGPERVLARLAELASHHPQLSVFATYQAEILLWEGCYEEAAVRFETEVSRAATRWGEVGLGAALAGLGQEVEAERVWALGHRRHGGALPGEATFVYQAEIAAKRGDLRAASAGLEGVLAAKPTRLRGWLLRAEIDWTRREDSAARAALLQALALCPGLAVTVNRTLLPLATLLLDGSGPSTAERDALIEWCRVLRAALRGNASSWLYTWFDAAGTLRVFQRVPYPDLVLAFTAIARMRAPRRGGGRS